MKGELGNMCIFFLSYLLQSHSSYSLGYFVLSMLSVPDAVTNNMGKTAKLVNLFLPTLSPRVQTFLYHLLSKIRFWCHEDLNFHAKLIDLSDLEHILMQIPDNHFMMNFSWRVMPGQAEIWLNLSTPIILLNGAINVEKYQSVKSVKLSFNTFFVSPISWSARTYFNTSLHYLYMLNSQQIWSNAWNILNICRENYFNMFTCQQIESKILNSTFKHCSNKTLRRVKRQDSLTTIDVSGNPLPLKVVPLSHHKRVCVWGAGNVVD